GTGWTATIPSADATTLKDGTLTVTTQVADQFGNQSVPATQTFAVHETLPTVASKSDEDGEENVVKRAGAQRGVTLSGSMTGLAAGATLEITVADGSFTHSYRATVNVQGTGWTATIPSADATTLKDGTLTVTTQVTGQFGNQSVPATQTFAVHETLPTVTISGLNPDTGSRASDGVTNGAVAMSRSVAGITAGATGGAHGGGE